jgi:hypothetical protein
VLRQCGFSATEKRPQATVPRRRLVEAVSCAASYHSTDSMSELARSLGDARVLRVAYYFGRYMPQQEDPALTIVVYSRDGKRGTMFDMALDGRNYRVANSADLLKGTKRWRVGEINGGLWSYTRLWYLAQEIGLRPRQEFTVEKIVDSQAQSCREGHPVWGTLAR